MQTGTWEIHVFHRTRCIQPVKEIGQSLRVLGLDSLFNSMTADKNVAALRPNRWATFPLTPLRP
jgi:hypothetical protein